MAATIQRPLRGSRVSTFYPVKNLPSLASLDSAFQLQEYISLLIRLDVHDVDAIISFPGTSAKDKELVNEQDKEQKDGDGNAKEGEKEGEKEKEKDVEREKEKERVKSEPVTVDEGCWIYEQLRRLAQDLSHPLITTLQQECTRASCPEMKAGEWLYLCVAHGNDGAMEQCCAIDYILHTVDSATALLNSPRTFPSRLSIPQTSHRHFSSLARRLGRIFAHAYFHHREAFEQAEAESSLYARFLALTAKFDLVPSEFLVIPSNHFGSEDAGSSRDREPSHYDYNDHGRGGHYQTTYQQQVGGGGGEHFHPAQKYRQLEHLGLEGGPRHPSSAPGLGETSSAGSANANASGGIGETPSATRSRFGRNRTDTMVFSDSEASAIADELAAKARAGQLELGPEFARGAPRTTARPRQDIELEKAPQLEDEEEEEEDGDDDEGEDGDLEGETQFEISLSPEEEINGTFADFTDLPTHLDKEREREPVSVSVSETKTISHSPAVVEPEVEQPPAKAEEPLQAAESENVEDTVVVVAEPSVTVREQEGKAVEGEKPAESTHVEESKPAELVVETSAPTSEPIAEATTPAPISTPTPAPEEPHEVVREVKEEVLKSETAPEPHLVTPVPPVVDSASDVKDKAVEAVIPPATETTVIPSSSEVSSSATEEPASAVEPGFESGSVPVAPAVVEPVAEPKDMDAPAPTTARADEGEEVTAEEEITPEEIEAIEEAIIANEMEAYEPEEGEAKSEELGTVATLSTAESASAIAAPEVKEDDNVAAAATQPAP